MRRPAGPLLQIRDPPTGENRRADFFGSRTTLPRNLSPDFLQYRSEQPEMVSHDEELKKAKNNNGEIDHYVY